MKTAIFPGTFDPFTLGHESIVNRGLSLFDKIIIAIGTNSDKRTIFSKEDRLEQIKACFKGNPKVEVHTYNGLTIDFAKQYDAKFIIRGIRSIADFEYEKLISDVNFNLSNIETILLFSEQKFESVQSSVVRELIKYNKDLTKFVPKEIIKLIYK